MVTRDDLKALSQLRLDEAKALLAVSANSGAYYLAGYAIECGLKACIATAFHAHVIPDKKLVGEIYTHDLAKLVRLAGLEPDLKVKTAADTVFAARWGIVANWEEASRYEIKDPISATAMVDCTDEVLQWIRLHW